jgi:hypothetical protein
MPPRTLAASNAAAKVSFFFMEDSLMFFQAPLQAREARI